MTINITARTLLTISLVAFATTIGGAKQSSTTISEADARAAVIATAHKYPAPADFKWQCGQLLSKINKDYDTAGVVISGLTASDHIRVWANGPANRICSDGAELLRRVEPLNAMAWVDEVWVNVASLTLSAPDVYKVVVTRDGNVVDQLPTSTLAFEKVTNAMGAEFQVPTGHTSYPRAAFAPGAKVRVNAISGKAGLNFDRTLSDGQLRKIQ
jgi:hypothetical protein